MIELKNITHIYEENTPDERVALKNVSFSVQDGETWCIIGHTGSGKSTLTEIMSGLLRPTEGQVLLDGKNTGEAKSLAGEFKGKVGMVFQYPEHQLFEETVIADIAFGPKNMGLGADECASRARSAMELVGLDSKYENLSPFELSGGEKRRVAIAGILAMHPDVLILDEPTAGLDPIGRDMLLDTLKKIKGSWCKSIVFVSHSMEDVARFADKVLVMNKGEVVMAGNVREVFARSGVLQEVGLDIPQITRLIHKLNEMGYGFDKTILTVEEARDAIYNRLKG